MKAWLLLVALVAGCTPQASSTGGDAVKPKPPSHTAPTTSVVPNASESQVPYVEIRVDGIKLDSRLVAALPSPERIEKVEGLFDALKKRKTPRPASDADGGVRGRVRILVDSAKTGRVLQSTFQTAAYAGYPRVTLVFGENRVSLIAQIPGPACEDDCDQVAKGYVMRALAGDRAFQLKISKADHAVREAGTAASEMRRKMPKFAAEHAAVSVVLYVDPKALASEFGPYVIEASSFGDTLPARHTTFSVRSFDKTPETSRPITINRWRDGSTSRLPPTDVSGRLAPERIQKEVRKSFGKFRKCYEVGLAKEPGLQGRIEVKFEIGDGGRVNHVDAVSDSLPKSVTQCVRSGFSQLVFPAPEGGVVSVTYPIVFSPEE